MTVTDSFNEYLEALVLAHVPLITLRGRDLRLLLRPPMGGNQHFAFTVWQL